MGKILTTGDIWDDFQNNVVISSTNNLPEDAERRLLDIIDNGLGVSSYYESGKNRCVAYESNIPTGNRIDFLTFLGYVYSTSEGNGYFHLGTDACYYVLISDADYADKKLIESNDWTPISNYMKIYNYGLNNINVIDSASQTPNGCNFDISIDVTYGNKKRTILATTDLEGGITHENPFYGQTKDIVFVSNPINLNDNVTISVYYNYYHSDGHLDFTNENLSLLTDEGVIMGTTYVDTVDDCLCNIIFTGTCTIGALNTLSSIEMSGDWEVSTNTSFDIYTTNLYLKTSGNGDHVPSLFMYISGATSESTFDNNQIVYLYPPINISGTTGVFVYLNGDDLANNKITVNVPPDFINANSQFLLPLYLEHSSGVYYTLYIPITISNQTLTVDSQECYLELTSICATNHINNGARLYNNSYYPISIRPLLNYGVPVCDIAQQGIVSYEKILSKSYISTSNTNGVNVSITCEGIGAAEVASAIVNAQTYMIPSELVSAGYTLSDLLSAEADRTSDYFVSITFNNA